MEVGEKRAALRPGTESAVSLEGAGNCSQPLGIPRDALGGAENPDVCGEFSALNRRLFVRGLPLSTRTF
jgi:hypothetical protein